MIGQLTIDGERLLNRIAEFAAIGATPGGGVNRQAYSIEDRRARRRIAELALAKGLAVRQDSAANLFISRPGCRQEPPLLIGSHLDSQLSGGRFDGALGSLAAFEVLETMQDRSLSSAVPIEVVIWSNEEGSRFAPGIMGSRAFADGALPDKADTIVDRDGNRLSQEIADTLKALPDVPVVPLGMPIAGYLELHIEQGPILETEAVSIGAVSSIQGTRWMEIRVDGETGHAGTTPHGARRDALVALVQALASLQSVVMPGDPDARFTVGRLQVEPGSINAIPSLATATVDIRHPSSRKLDEMEKLLRSTVEACAREEGCSARVECLFDRPPAGFDAALVACIEEAATARELSVKRIVSGAFHDALSIQPLAPTAMLFVPCRGGISHNAMEFVEPESCVAGGTVLLEATLRAADKIAQGNINKNKTLKAHTGNQKRMGT